MRVWKPACVKEWIANKLHVLAGDGLWLHQPGLSGAHHTVTLLDLNDEPSQNEFYSIPQCTTAQPTIEPVTEFSEMARMIQQSQAKAAECEFCQAIC